MNFHSLRGFCNLGWGEMHSKIAFMKYEQGKEMIPHASHKHTIIACKCQYLNGLFVSLDN